MNYNDMTQLIEMRNQLLISQRKIYVITATNLNMRYNNLLKDDFGSKLLDGCKRDIAGEIVRKYFDTSDYYLTIDQMCDRIMNFTYNEDCPDPLANFSDQIRKSIYNMNDNPMVSKTLKNISKDCQESQKKLFEKEEYVDKKGNINKRYVDRKMMENAKGDYRESQQDEQGMTHDSLTRNSSKEERLEVDHVQATATARYNSKYLNSPEAIQALKEFYNSPNNFQMLEKTANGSKGDVRVYSDGTKNLSKEEVSELRKNIKNQLKEEYIANGTDPQEAERKATSAAEEEITRKYDVTYKASASEVADAVCNRWENASEVAKEKLMKTGKLDKNGKVPPEVRKQLEKELRASMNAESKVILKHLDYGKVAGTAFDETKKGLAKIVAGQVVYYVLPPVVYESRKIIRKKHMTIERFCDEFKVAGKRITKYVINNIGNMLKNVMGNSLNKFVKAFFDIVIETVKETVKKLVKMAKQLALSLIQCVKIISSKVTTKKEKADAVTKTLSATIVAVILEVLFEYMEKQFGIPDIIMEPLQIIVSVIATNLVMLILEKADLFDVRYGLLIENIDAAFNEESVRYEKESIDLLIQSKLNMESCFDQIKNKLDEIQTNINEMNFYYTDVVCDLNEINKIYNMGIDFDNEWNQYCKLA